MEPTQRGNLPTSLIVVAVLFILFGVLSVFEVLIALLHGRISINLGVLNLFVGLGLLRLSRGWRTCGLVFLWIALIGLPLFALLILATARPLDLSLFGRKIGHAHDGLGLLVAAAMFALVLWEYRVLTRPDVRRLFGLPGV